MTDLVMVKGLQVIRDALLGWLDPIKTTIAGGVVWGLGNVAQGKQALPLIVFQPDPRGKAKRYIGMPAGWVGDVTMRVRADTPEAATDWTNQAAELIPQAIHLDDDDYAPGWDLTMTSVAPLTGFPGPKIATAGVVYRFKIQPRAPAA